MTQRVLVSVEDGLARVRLNRAEKHNGLDFEMFTAIVAAQKKVARDRCLRAVVLSGDGEDFSSGLDVRSIMENRRIALKLIWKWLPWTPNLAQAVSVGWRRMPLPVIAAVHGRCWGGGLQIALGADFRIVHPDASLSVMEGELGLIPDMGGTLALRDLMSRDQALRLAMTAEKFGAAEAFRLGIATEVNADVEGAALDLARRLADRSPDTVAAVKRLYRKSWQGGEGAALARETAYQWRVLSGANQRIAVRRRRGEDREYRPARKW